MEKPMKIKSIADSRNEDVKNSLLEPNMKDTLSGFKPRCELDDILYKMLLNCDEPENSLVHINDNYFENILTSYGVPPEYHGGDDNHYGYCRDWFYLTLYDKPTHQTIYDVSDEIINQASLYLKEV